MVTDPPYGDTSLDWDQPVKGWLDLIDTRQVWCFGSMRFWLEHGSDFREDWTYAQEIVWEKHNGSGFAADRFKRVHELALHWYQGPWSTLHLNPPVVVGQPRKRGTRRANGTPHTGEIAASHYDSTVRLKRSVLQVRSEHGRAIHPTQKPVGIVDPLVRFSVRQGGLVLDPFMGSATTLVAAKQSGRRAIGIEINEQYCTLAAERFAQQSLDLVGAEISGGGGSNQMTVDDVTSDIEGRAA
ncbi:MAG TPA: site-specific DNA-methyltransferase [Solirubrobacterales bacterium]